MGGEELGLYSAGTAAWFDQDVSMGGRVLVMYGSPSRFLHGNSLGTTTVTTDQTGAELQDELFYPWGQDWTRAGQPYVMHFAGMQGFEDPGLVYPTDFRKYNPALGRWMTPDPLAGDVTNPQSLNRYVYALNNPVSNTDPQGLEPCRPGARNYENDCADDGASVDLTSLGNVGVLTPQASEHGVPGSHDSSGGAGDTLLARSGLQSLPKGKDPCLGSGLQRIGLVAKAGVNAGVAAVKIGIASASALAIPETGGGSALGVAYGLIGASGNLAAAGTQLIGAVTGNVRGASQMANVATTVTTASGFGTLIATRGNMEAASTAATFESLGTAGINGGRTGQLIDQGLAFGQKFLLSTKLGEDFLDAVGMNDTTGCKQSESDVIAF